MAYDPSIATPALMKAAVEKAGYGVREVAAEPASTPSATVAATSPWVTDIVLPILLWRACAAEHAREAGPT